MAEKQPPEKSANKSAARRSADGFTAEERAAMKERAQELKKEGRRGAAKKGGGEADVLAKIAELDESDRTIAERLHALVQVAAPDLKPKTWYGMPAYARDGKVVVFFQAATKFGSRYATLGFSDQARLDEGDLWPSAYAVAGWSDEVERRVVELVRRAAG
jgi:uncharacterized protein YdhG (YjbR/CyaY superfamily)